MKKRLCVLPWIHTQVEYHGHTKVCAVSGCGQSVQPTTGYIGNTSVLDIIHQEPTARIRQRMLSGEWPDECAYCLKREQLGMSSFREEHNARFPVEYQRLLEGDLEPGILSLDLRLSNVCNFKCRMCSGWPSTAWHDDHNAVFPEAQISRDISSIVNMGTFWKDLKHAASGLKALQLAGGETLLQPAYYWLLEMLLKKGNDSVSLYCDTNLSTLKHLDKDVIAFWNLFKDVTVSLSLEGVGKKGEYIRNGLNYDRWIENALRIKREAPHVKLRMHMTISIFNVLDFRFHYDEIMKTGLIDPKEMELTMVEWPPFLNARCLPHDLKQVAKRRLEDMLQSDPHLSPNIATHIRSMIEYLDSEDLSQALGGEFVRVTRLLDERRGEDVRVVFPELAPLFA